MEIKSNFNPVGTIKNNIPGFNELVDKMKLTWTELKKQIGSVNLKMGVQFLTKCVDSLVVYVAQHNIAGSDKKATVLDAISSIYDNVIVGIMPIWLRPFSGPIKTLIINVLISHLIDVFVEKYNNGSWSPKATTEVLSMWKV